MTAPLTAAFVAGLLVVAALGQSGAPAAAVDAEAAALRQSAATDAQRLESDIAAKERSWRVLFVGRLRQGRNLAREDDVFAPLRHAQRTVDDVRRELRGVDEARTRGAIDSAQQIDRLAPLIGQALLGRWQLVLDEAEHAVALVRQTYEDVATETRRQREVEATREAAGRREADARAAASRSYAAAAAALKRGRDETAAALGALAARLRRAGRAAAADAILAEIESALEATPAGGTSLPTSLDRFLDRLAIDFEGGGDDPPKPLAMAGTLAAIDVTRVGVTPAARAISFLRIGPLGPATGGTTELPFGALHTLEVELDSDGGPDEREVTLSWADGATARTMAVTARRYRGTTFRSDPIAVWPLRGATAAPLMPPPPPVIGGGAAGRATATSPAAVDPELANIDREIAAARVELARKTQAAQDPATRVAGPRGTRARVRVLRESIDRLRRTVAVPPPPADSSGAQALATFRERWADLAAAILAGRPAPEPMTPERFAALTAALDKAPCKDLPRRTSTARVVGRDWACLSDAFFAEFVRHADEVDRISDRLRANGVAGLDAAIGEVERGLAPENAPADTPAARAAWLNDITTRLERAELEEVTVRLADLERWRGVATDTSTPYAWFLRITTRPTVRPQPGVAPTVIRAAPRTRIQASMGSFSYPVTVAAELPADVARFFAHALFEAHDEARTLTREVDAAIDAEVRAYEAFLDRRFPETGDVEFENSIGAGLRRGAVEERRRLLRARATERLADVVAQLAAAREHALAAIGEAR